jgi:hypothetical protein
LGNCCFRSARVLAVVGAVTALSAAAFGQTASHVSQNTPVGKNTQPTVSRTPVAAPQGKLVAPPAYRATDDAAAFAAYKAANLNGPSGFGKRGPGANNCADAPTVSEGAHAYDLTGATNDWPGTCGATATAEDVWLRYVATDSGTTFVSTCGGTGGDSVISVLDECGGPQILCLDDFCGLQTEVQFAATAGEDYLIRMADFAGGVHSGTVTISQPGPCVLTPPGPGTPENEPCGTDTNGGCNSLPEIFGSIACGEVVSGNAWASAGTRDTDWYQLDLDGPHQITITGQAQFPLQLFIIGNVCPATIVAAGSAPICGIATVSATVGGSVRIFAGNTGFDGNPCGANNDYWVQVTTCTPIEGVGNDFCVDATEVGEGTFDYDLTTATNDWAGTCGASGASPDVWFRYTASFSGSAVVSTCGLSGGDSVITVLEECGGPQILCLDDFCGLQTEVTFGVTTGEDYLIRMAGFAGGVHAGQFSISQLAPCVLTPPGKGTPENEPCGTDTNGGCNSVPPIFSTIACGEVAAGNAWASAGTRDTDWYDLPLDGPHSVTISGQGQFPLQLFILDNSCPPAILGAASAPRCGIATLTVLVGGSARIFAGNTGFDGNPCGADNDYWLSVDNCTPVEGPANDDCADAIAISGPGPHAFDNTLATTDGFGDPLCAAFGTDQINNDLWWTWTSDCAAGQQIDVSTCGQSVVDTKIAVYDGADCVGAILACNDDATDCPLQSRASWIAGAPGSVYKIRVGSFPGAAGGPGSFTFECVKPCLGVDPDPNGLPEGEDCGLDTNGGCNSVPNLWFDLTCNGAVNGTAWADLGTRDTDWYRATVPASGSVSVTIEPEIPVAVFILTIAGTDPCGAITFNAIGGAGECDVATISASGLIPGDSVYFFVGAGTPAGGGIFDGFPCGRPGGNDYVANFDVGLEPCAGNACPCNFNHDAALNSQDFFDFLSCFFGGACPAGEDADYNNDTVVNSQDFFDFLVCFFAPPKACP